MKQLKKKLKKRKIKKRKKKKKHKKKKRNMKANNQHKILPIIIALIIKLISFINVLKNIIDYHQMKKNVLIPVLLLVEINSNLKIYVMK